ncbi:SDR family NAD(P)-dependent oxidoreductase [Lysinibacillus fusiformis]|uniref:SDR family NAD(P)-dependent oxidoreductase n=1 Tax=Lysinibacillus fusiformis TaxID=28031 RepID=UPI0037FD7BF2
MEKKLLILGASSEVGVDFISKNHQFYASIVAHYNNLNEDLIALKGILGEKIILIHADFLDINSVESFVDRLKNFEINHILHLSSTKVKNNKFHKMDWSVFQQSYDVQVRSVFFILQECLVKMSKSNYGKVVFLLSSVTNNEPPKYWSDYVTNKYALLGLMKALAQEYAVKKININAVSPSMMETKFLENIPDLIIEQNAANAKLGRNAKTSDVVSMIQFLLSNEADYITGQNFIISGGN